MDSSATLAVGDTAWQDRRMQDDPALLRVQADPRIVIDPSEVGRVVEEIFPEALGVWIYGSFAHGRARRNSDLDIGILPVGPLDSWERLERAQDVAARDPYVCDVLETTAVKMFQRLNEGQREHLALIKARSLAP